MGLVNGVGKCGSYLSVSRLEKTPRKHLILLVYSIIILSWQLPLVNGNPPYRGIYHLPRVVLIAGGNGKW